MFSVHPFIFNSYLILIGFHIFTYELKSPTLPLEKNMKKKIRFFKKMIIFKEKLRFLKKKIILEEKKLNFFLPVLPPG